MPALPRSPARTRVLVALHGRGVTLQLDDLACKTAHKTGVRAKASHARGSSTTAAWGRHRRRHATHRRFSGDPLAPASNTSPRENRTNNHAGQPRRRQHKHSDHHNSNAAPGTYQLVHERPGHARRDDHFAKKNRGVVREKHEATHTQHVVTTPVLTRRYGHAPIASIGPRQLSCSVS